MTKSYEDAISDVLAILNTWKSIAIVSDAITVIEKQVMKLLITAQDNEKQDN